MKEETERSGVTGTEIEGDGGSKKRRERQMSSMAELHNEILQIWILKLKREYSARFDYS